jgi:hypothetical protein
VAYNNVDGIYALSELIEAILDRYFPVPPFENQPASGDASRVEGTYRTNRIDHHTFMSLPSALAAQRIDVTSRADGSIETPLDMLLATVRVTNLVDPSP